MPWIEISDDFAHEIVVRPKTNWRADALKAYNDIGPVKLTQEFDGELSSDVVTVDSVDYEPELTVDDEPELTDLDIRIRRLAHKLMEETEDADDVQPAMATSSMTDIAHLVFLGAGFDPENLGEESELQYAEFEQGLFTLIRAAFEFSNRPADTVTQMQRDTPDEDQPLPPAPPAPTPGGQA